MTNQPPEDYTGLPDCDPRESVVFREGNRVWREHVIVPYWIQTYKIGHHKFTCGYCGALATTDEGYSATDRKGSTSGFIFGVIAICPGCGGPTYISRYVARGPQVPAPMPGQSVDHLPSAAKNIYEEARRCIQIEAPNAAVMLCRTLIMHVAVEKGAKKGSTFNQYVEYLDGENYIPPGGKHWVAHIKDAGNDAAHELTPIKSDYAEEILSFTAMLLTFVYDFPNRLAKRPRDGKTLG